MRVTALAPHKIQQPADIILSCQIRCLVIQPDIAYIVAAVKETGKKAQDMTSALRPHGQKEGARGKRKKPGRISRASTERGHPFRP